MESEIDNLTKTLMYYYDQLKNTDHVINEIDKQIHKLQDSMETSEKNKKLFFNLCAERGSNRLHQQNLLETIERIKEDLENLAKKLKSEKQKEQT